MLVPCASGDHARSDRAASRGTVRRSSGRGSPVRDWPRDLALEVVPRQYSVQQNQLTTGRQLAILRAMRRIVRTVTAIRFAWSTRRDLLLESLALRHQLGVLARSNRRLRPADRLLCLILRRVWARLRDALMLVQPATVDRWHRERFSRCWPRRARRPEDHASMQNAAS
jgi:hypothetical protein